MTNWRAVGAGFLVAVVLGLALPGLGHVAGGLIAGAVAGYLAGGGIGSGAWHGLLAGAIGGIVIAIILLVASIPFGPIGALVGGSLALVAIFATFILALDSAIGGAIGAMFSEN